MIAKLEEVSLMYDHANQRHGVAIRGFRYVCQLPEGYDELSVIRDVADGMVLLAHPLHPPLVCDPRDGSVREVH
jgi:hypothetical protein